MAGELTAPLLDQFLHLVMRQPCGRGVGQVALQAAEGADCGSELIDGIEGVVGFHRALLSALRFGWHLQRWKEEPLSFCPFAAFHRVPSIFAVTAGSPILGTICSACIGVDASATTSTMSRYTSGSASSSSINDTIDTASSTVTAGDQGQATARTSPLDSSK
ncbi:hypothetical protein [Streptomyces purpurascens]|uniref:Uncharacterized protein n=1 Tax=Streptomyces purpurascens TaxID=1924 RepID=A0ABZ1MTP3_STREF